jgi:hypothetical protein
MYLIILIENKVNVEIRAIPAKADFGAYAPKNND